MTKGHRGKTISEAAFKRMWADPKVTVVDMAAALGISPQAVSRRAMHRGLSNRGRLAAISIKDDEAFKAMWEAGKTLAEIAEHFGCCRHSATATRKRLGLKPRPRGPRTKICDETLRRLWEAGVARAEIARHMGTAESSITKARKRLGLAPRATGGPDTTITIAEYLQQQLGQRLAASAEETRRTMAALERATRPGQMSKAA